MNNDVRTGMHMPTLPRMPTRRGTPQPGGILGEFREPTSFGQGPRRLASRRATRETALKLGRPRLCPEESQPARRTHVYTIQPSSS